MKIKILLATLIVSSLMLSCVSSESGGGTPVAETCYSDTECNEAGMDNKFCTDAGTCEDRPGCGAVDSPPCPDGMVCRDDGFCGPATAIDNDPTPNPDPDKIISEDKDVTTTPDPDTIIEDKDAVSNPDPDVAEEDKDIVANPDVDAVVPDETPDLDSPSNCGNGKRDIGEACDDGNKTSGDGCNGACAEEAGWTCNEDGFGKSMCENTCGNKVLDAGEECEQGDKNTDKCEYGISNCCSKSCKILNGEYCGEGKKNGPEGCDDGGKTAGDGCDAACKIESGYICIENNDGKSTCTKSCGNSKVDAGEDCDNGVNNTDTCGYAATCCSKSCKTIIGGKCGDNVKNGTEQCDDGNTNNNDACKNDCTTNICGDGAVLTGTEQCDEGANNGNTDCGYGQSCAKCSVQCKTVNITGPSCGDGKLTDSEICDDGNKVDGDGCKADCSAVEDGWNCTDVENAKSVCTSKNCGDGIKAGTEECDLGNENGNTDCGYEQSCPKCSADCKSVNITGPHCGDSKITDGEICDDGNSISGDGCDDTCLAVEDGWTCTTNADGKSECVAKECGDGIKAGAEQCDDGNINSGDGCSETCTDEYGIVMVTTGGKAQSNYGHTCVIKTDGKIFCWGDNTYGQVGNNSATQKIYSPVEVSGDMRWASVSAGESHTCAIEKDTNKIFCWGYNNKGQLGDSSLSNSRIPVEIFGDKTWKKVVSGGFHTCAIDSDNKAFCWGSNSHSQLGVPDNDPFCYHDGAYTSYCYEPVEVSGSSEWQDISSGGGSYSGAEQEHSCGIKIDGTLWCWGSNDYRQISGTYDTEGDTRQVGAASNWTKVNISSRTSCAINSLSELYCWGRNDYNDGQCGVNSTGSYITSPTKVTTPLSTGWSNVEVGYAHACGINNGKPYCWGNNGWGIGGDGNTSSDRAPVAVEGYFDANEVSSSTTGSPISAGGSHTCAVGVDKELYCWGNDAAGQLGNGSVDNADKTTPVKVTVVAAAKKKAVETTKDDSFTTILYTFFANIFKY